MAARFALKLLSTALLVGASLPALAAPRPIVHEDLWLMPRLAAPAVSPDGRWAVVTVARPAYDEKAKESDLWLVATADGAARQLTQTAGGESGVTWSADSRRIAFSARRGDDEAEQVYILDLDGGEARRVTALVGGARNPVFSPDGRALAFESQAWPGTLSEDDNRKAHEERKARKYNARIYTSFPIRNWDRWIDGRQARLQVLSLGADGMPAGTPRDLLAGTKLVSGSGYAGRRGDGGDVLDVAWAPDGQSLVFAASTDADRAGHAFTSSTLFSIPLAGGEPRALTGAGRSCARPVFSPDGRQLIALCDSVNEYVYNHTRVLAMDWPAAAALRELTGSWDRSVASFAVSPDSRTVWITAEEGGHEKLFAVPTAGGTVRTVMDLRDGSLSSLVAAPRSRELVLLALHDSAAQPKELVRMTADGRRMRALTSFTRDRVAALDLPKLESFTFRSSRGRDIQNFIVRPPGFDPARKYPLFVVIHGGPHTMFRDEWVLRWNYHLLAAPGYVVLLTNYSGSTGFGERSARIIQGDPLRSAGEEINEAADEAIRRYGFVDGSRQCAGGASYGGHLSNWLQATTTRYRCLVSHAGLVSLDSQYGTSDVTYPREVNNGGPVWEQGPIWREQNPIRFADRFQTPVLVTIGEQDFRVPLNNSLEYWTLLKRRQIESRLVVFPDENHWVLKGENSRLFYQEIHGWLARWLK